MGDTFPGIPAGPRKRALPACHSSKGCLRVLSDLFRGWVGIGVRGHREWNPLSSVNLKLFIVAPGGRILGMQPDLPPAAPEWSGDRLRLTQGRVTSERKAMFPGVKQPAPGKQSCF